MRTKKIKASDFASVYTKRKLGFRERYLQSFLLIEEEGKYEIHQKLNILGRLVTVVMIPIMIIPVSIYGGLKECYSFVIDSYPYVLGKAIRKDALHMCHEQTSKIIKIAWCE